jgi:hypothetical protein
MMKRITLFLLLLSLALWGGCSTSTGEPKGANEGQKMSEKASATPTPSPMPRSYSTDLNEVRANFNRDKGKVRLVTLLSPT